MLSIFFSLSPSLENHIQIAIASQAIRIAKTKVIRLSYLQLLQMFFTVQYEQSDHHKQGNNGTGN